MRSEVYVSYVIALKYDYTFRDLLGLRYSTEANDRVKYEMLILTIGHKIKDLNISKAIEMPADFSDFIEVYMPLNQEWTKEKFIRLITK